MTRREIRQTAAAVAIVGLTLALGGCPQEQQTPVKVQITPSATRGPAPLRLTLSAAGSFSDNGGALTFLWDLAGEATATTESITHTFNTPGRKTVRLTATDATGATASSSVDIRVAGGPVTAVIAADPTSGNAPLTVRFDGTASDPPDDEILDYFWDFGDGATARSSKPVHTYTVGGTYTVTLRAVSGGGVEDEVEATINVTATTAALQFNGSQFATLPLGSAAARSAFSLEGWFRAEAAGGVLFTLGEAALTLEVFPNSNSIEWSLGSGAPSRATASNLAGGWRHIALTHDAASGVRVYLDAQPIGSSTGVASLSAGQLIIGNGFVGKLSEVRFWGVARTAAEIAAGRGQRARTPINGLVGSWPLSEGSGQSLRNIVSPTPGVLGTGNAVESSDPAWTNDAPPIGG